MSSFRHGASIGLAACAAALFALSASCGDDENAGTGGSVASGGSGGSGGNGTGGAGASITVVVSGNEGAGAPDAPLAGAQVAFDRPDGERAEATTDAQGKVTFGDVDWSAGKGALTAYSDGYAVISTLNLGETVVTDWANEDGELLITLPSLTPAAIETVTVSGTATGLADVSHYYTVNFFGAPGLFVEDSEWSGTGSHSFTITVPKGVAISLQAFEYGYTEAPSGQGYDRPIYSVTRLDLGAIDEDVTDVVLDFTVDALPTLTADVAMLLPESVDSPLREGSPDCVVCAANSNYCEGWPTHLDISADGNQFETSFVWYEPPTIEEPLWFCRVSNGEESATTYVDGYPQAGGTGALLDVPRWVVPSDLSTAHPIHEPLEWNWLGADVPASNVAILRTGQVVWYVLGGANATTVTIPQLPAGLTDAQIVGTFPRASIYGGTLEDNRWVQYAQSLSIPIAE